MLKWQTCKREDEEENEDQIQGMQSCSADVRWEPTTAADCTISNRVNPTDRQDSAGERRTEPPPVKPKPPPGSKPPVVGAYPPPVSTKPLLPSKMRIPSTGARPQEPANTSNRLIPATSAPGNFNPAIRSHLPTDQQRLRRPPDRPMLMGGAAQVRPAATSAPVRGVSGRAPSSPPVHAPADPNVAPTARLDSTDSKAIAYRGLPQSVTSSCRQIPVNSTTHTRGGYTSLANRYPHLAGSPSQAPPHDAVHTGSREMSGMNARSPTMHSSVSSLTDSERSFTSTDVADRSWPQRYDGKERSLTRKHVRFAAEHQIHNVSVLESDSDTESQADVVRQAEVIVHVEGEPPDSNKTNVKQTINFIKNANNNSVAANRNRDFSTHSDHKHLSQALNQIISTSKQLNSSPLASAQQPQAQSLVQPHTQGQSSMPMNNRVSQDSEKLSRPPSAQAADSELRIPPPSYRVTLQQRRVADQAAVAAAAAFAAKVAAASKVDKPSNGPKIANDSGMSLSPSSNSSADTHNIPEVSRNVPQLPSHLTTQLFGTRKPLAPSDTTTSDLDTSTTSTERPHI